jgi:hypothetical protein
MRTKFSGGMGSECSGVAMEHNLYKNMGDIDMCTEFDMFEVKVSVFFSVQWVSRYVGRDVTARVLAQMG